MSCEEEREQRGLLLTQGRQPSLDAMFYVCKYSAHSMAVELFSPLDH